MFLHLFTHQNISVNNNHLNLQTILMDQGVNCKSDLSTSIKSSKVKSFEIPYRCKVTSLVSILVLALAIAILFALMFFLEPKLTVVNNKKITHPDGSLHGIAQFRITQRNILQPDINMTFYMTYVAQEGTKGRTLQNSNPNYLVHSLEPDIGVTLRMSSQGNTSFFINQRQFQSFAKKQLQKNSTVKSTNLKVNSQKEYLEDLSSIFEGAIKESTGTPNIKIKFNNITMAKLKINPSKFMQMEFDTSSDRLLVGQQRNLAIIAGIIGLAKLVLPKVTGFLVKTMTKFGPIIGKAAGKIIGKGVSGFFGGSLSPFQNGMASMIGNTIGNAASSLVNACIPQGTLQISCTPESIGSVMSQFGGSNSFMGIANQMMPNLAGQVSAANFNYMFGGGGNIFGHFRNQIPQNALSFFGLGSIIN